MFETGTGTRAGNLRLDGVNSRGPSIGLDRRGCHSPARLRSPTRREFSRPERPTRFARGRARLDARGLRFRLISRGVVAAGWLLCAASGLLANGTSLRFYGHGVSAPDLDRVKIPLQTNRPVDVGGSFTVEFWMKAALGENTGTVTTGNDGWITGNIIFDRDVYGGGDYGDWGIAMGGGRLAFGIHNGSWGTTIVGTNLVADSQWHHVAVTRQLVSGGSVLRIFVDGVLDAQGSGPGGDISYRDGRATAWPNSDPYLVVGAEKHDAGPEYPSYSGWLDEVRISNVARYTNNFTPPTSPFTPDAATVALYHFDEGADDTIGDASPSGASPGVRRFGGGGTPGPAWSTDTPFVTPAPPTLHATLSTAGWITLWWTPPTGTNWILQERPSLSTGSWTNSPSGWTNPVTVPAAFPEKLYRLFKP
ncbi:MAG: LamG domain-containing protein [Limisphaera sp.]|nr:LamG domain-containing protein [Limisphaera sp.]